MKVERMSVGVERKERYIEREKEIETWKIWSEIGGSRQRWRRLSVGGGVANIGAVVVTSLVAMVRWTTIMGMWERERGKEREREKKKNKKKQGVAEARWLSSTSWGHRQ